MLSRNLHSTASLARAEVEIIRRRVRFQRLRNGVSALLLSLALHGAFFLGTFGLGYRFFSRDWAFMRAPLARPFAVEAVSRAESEEALAAAQPEEDLRGIGAAGFPAVRPETEARLQPPGDNEDLMTMARGSLAGPGETPRREAWQARREILEIEERKAQAELAVLPRKSIPKVERTRAAADILLSVNREALPAAGEKLTAAAAVGATAPGPADIAQTAAAGAQVGPMRPGVVAPGGKGGSSIFDEGGPALRPIENLLTAEISVFKPADEPGYGYFKIEIRRSGEEALPVLQKDIVLVQDCSASISAQRLEFCKIGLLCCLAQLQPGDRFNVISFRDAVEMCFEDWAENESSQVMRARDFAGSMVSQGATDIFASLRRLLELKRTPGRPVIAFVITDGRPTVGLTHSSNIIGEFSKLNEGSLSVFTMGTVQTANAYLLDLLGYCNRGAGWVNTRGRWNIPDLMQSIMQAVGRPVVTDLRFRFAAGSNCEVYPVLTENLYLDRPLALYGRYLTTTTNVVFQAVGQGADTRCDMVFDLSLERPASQSGPELRTAWARQKIYHLIGQYARRANPATLEELIRTARRYGIDVPYRAQLEIQPRATVGP